MDSCPTNFTWPQHTAIGWVFWPHLPGQLVCSSETSWHKRSCTQAHWDPVVLSTGEGKREQKFLPLAWGMEKVGPCLFSQQKYLCYYNMKATVCRKITSQITELTTCQLANQPTNQKLHKFGVIPDATFGTECKTTFFSPLNSLKQIPAWRALILYFCFYYCYYYCSY